MGIEDFLEAVGIICINCGNIIVCLLENQTIEKFITPFFTEMAFPHVCLSCIIKPNQKIGIDFQLHYPYWVINGPWYNTVMCSQLHALLFSDYVTSVGGKGCMYKHE